MALTNSCPRCGSSSFGPAHICSGTLHDDSWYRNIATDQALIGRMEDVRNAIQDTGLYGIAHTTYPSQLRGQRLAPQHEFVTMEKVQEMIREALVSAAQDEKMKDVPVVTPVQVARAINSALDAAAACASTFGAQRVVNAIRGMKVPV